MRIVWDSDVADQIIRRLNEAEQGMEACERDALRAMRALEEANEDGESKTLNRLAEQLTELNRRMRAAQQRLEDLVADARSTNERFEDVEKKISRMMDGLAETAAGGGKPRQNDWVRLIDKVEIMPPLRVHTGWYTPGWLNALAGDPKNFLM